MAEPGKSPGKCIATEAQRVDIITLMYTSKPNSRNYASTAILAMAWSSVAQYQIVLHQCSALVPNCLGSEVSRHRTNLSLTLDLTLTFVTLSLSRSLT